MTEPDKLNGVVHRLGFHPEAMQRFEALRMRTQKLSIDDMIREALYDVAAENGFAVQRRTITEPMRQRIAAEGVLDNDDVRSIKSGRVAVKKEGRVYIELILLYDGDDNWPERLREKLGCSSPSKMIMRVLEAYEAKLGE